MTAEPSTNIFTNITDQVYMALRSIEVLSAAGDQRIEALDERGERILRYLEERNARKKKVCDTCQTEQEWWHNRRNQCEKCGFWPKDTLNG